MLSCMVELLPFIDYLPKFIMIDGCLISLKVIYHILFVRILHIINWSIQGIILYSVKLEVSLLIDKKQGKPTESKLFHR